MEEYYPVKDAQFIYSKNEFGYQEVLDDMSNASEIIIVTYNVSKDGMLIDCLKSVRDNCVVTIITNIPNRWKEYFNSQSKKRASNEINKYLDIFKREKFNNNFYVFFNFENHGKIIMTNNIVYIGSQNYSEASESNIEFGIISRDKNFISFLKSDVLPDILDKSTPYYVGLKVLNELNKISNKIKNIQEALPKDINVKLDSEALEGMRQIIDEFYKKSDKILNIIKKIQDNIDISENELNTLADEIKNLLSNNFFNEDWDLNRYILRNLDNLDLEPYEEGLESSINFLQDEFYTEYNKRICVQYKLLDVFNKFVYKYSEFIKYINYLNLKVNPKIDNTKI